MSEVSIIGLDLAKHVFQIHGVDAEGRKVLGRRLRRSELLTYFAEAPSCLVAMEACGGSHHWAREIASLGHEVRLLPPAHVRPYVKPGRKSDAADAAALCEAVVRPCMRFVPVKSAEQQGMLLLHRSRDLLVRQRTMLINALRSHLAEFGLIARQGRGGFAELRAMLEDEAGHGLPEAALGALRLLAGQIDEADTRIAALDREIVERHRRSETSLRLASIPGIGPLIASALAASVPDAASFSSGRQFAAWLGLVPRQHSTGGKQRLGSITKTGDRYLRRLLVIGATGLIRYRRANVPGGLPWLQAMLARKPARLVSVALANRMARIVWAILARGGTYRALAAA